MTRLRHWLIFAAFSIVLVPVVIFLGGTWLAGPYEGDNGIFGMMGRIYGDALTGQPGALLTLLAPVLLLAIWQGALVLRQRMTKIAAEPAATNQGQ